jgi:hypothetical protein
MMGITRGERATLRVLREDISPEAPFYVTSTHPDIIQITSPAAGSPLGADGDFEMLAVETGGDGPVKVQVRLGSTTGPILGEMEPHIFRLRSLRIAAHLVQIDGVNTNRTANSLVDHFRRVNDVLRPCGIEFIYRMAQTSTVQINGSRFRVGTGGWQPLPNPLGAAGRFATPGTVTTNIGGGHWEEFSTLLQINIVANAINVYCVHDATEWLGLTYDNEVARPNGYGVVIRDDASPYTATAHELGHFLNLDLHSDENSSGTTFRRDIWTLRRLMSGIWPINQSPAYRHTVGYRGNDSGAMITLKNFGGSQDPNDGECARAINRARNPY